MANPERRSRLLDWYGNVNRVTFGGAVVVAGAAVVVPPLSPLFVPAVGWALVDGVQIVFIDKINKKKKPQLNVSYKAEKPTDQRIPMEAFEPINQRPKENIIFLNPFVRFSNELQDGRPRDNVVFVNIDKSKQPQLPQAA